MTHDLFISYSTEDKRAADAVCAILESRGVRCWVAPRDIMPGADWGESIVRAIRASRVMLLVFSTNANKSKQIKREVEIAADGGVTIVSLRIENIFPTESFKYFLGNIHWMDALTPPLEKHLENVADKVKAILDIDALTSEDLSNMTSPVEALEGKGSPLEPGDSYSLWRKISRCPRYTATLVVLIMSLSVGLFFAVTMPTAVNLSGTWTANDGATYVIQQEGRVISWTGGNPPYFKNVFRGQIADQGYIEGNWQDLPGYTVFSGGVLKLEAVSPVRLIAVEQTGNFSGTVWTKTDSKF